MPNVKAKNLREVINEFAVRLAERITPAPGEESKITLEQQLSIFKELQRWYAIDNKINPDSPEDGGKIDDYRKRLGGGAGGNRSAGGTDGNADGGEAEDGAPAIVRGKTIGTGSASSATGIAAIIAKKPKHHDAGISEDDDEDISDDGDDSGE
jgi:hypothetical protein